MATTKESIEDGLLWIRKLLVSSAKKAVVILTFVGIFALVLWFTGRESFSDCLAVTAEQRTQLSTLTEPDEQRTWTATGTPQCTRGVFAQPVTGIKGDLDEIADELLGQGWIDSAVILPPFYDLRATCFRSTEPGWESIELTVAARRSGEIARSEVVAPEGREACEPFRCESLSTGCERYDRLESNE